MTSHSYNKLLLALIVSQQWNQFQKIGTTDEEKTLHYGVRRKEENRKFTFSFVHTRKKKFGSPPISMFDLKKIFLHYLKEIVTFTKFCYTKTKTAKLHLNWNCSTDWFEIDRPNVYEE